MTPDDLRIALDHPSLPGHFPGQPVVPAVIILDAIAQALAYRQPPLQMVGLRKVKFLQQLAPEQNFRIEFGAPVENCIRCRCWSGEQLLAEGTLRVEQPKPLNLDR